MEKQKEDAQQKYAREKNMMSCCWTRQAFAVVKLYNDFFISRRRISRQLSRTESSEVWEKHSLHGGHKNVFFSVHSNCFICLTRTTTTTWWKKVCRGPYTPKQFPWFPFPAYSFFFFFLISLISQLQSRAGVVFNESLHTELSFFLLLLLFCL